MTMINFIPPPNLKGYDRRKRPQQQPASVPKAFVDAMAVRGEVFVHEQGVPLENELDEDDSRSCHWVLYGDILTEQGTPPAIGTLRLVPYPQSPHPVPGGVYVGVDGDVPLQGTWTTKPGDIVDGKPTDSATFVPAGPAGTTTEEIADRATTLHDGKEPYVKLGRLAVINTMRGSGYGRTLVNTALEWMKNNPNYFEPKGAVDGAPKFNGLVCVHAQVQAASFWKRVGFQPDEGMGIWWEEGMPHIGMFLRLSID